MQFDYFFVLFIFDSLGLFAICYYCGKGSTLSEPSKRSVGKMPLHGFPLGIAEAIDLPENRAYVKTSPNLYINRKVEADIVARVEEEPHVVARVEEEPRVVARVEEPSVVARVDEPHVIARVEEELPVTAHAEGPRKLHVSSSFNNVDEIKADIDTSRPIESVKHAVSKFEGSIDWKARRALNFQKVLIYACISFFIFPC